MRERLSILLVLLLTALPAVASPAQAQRFDFPPQPEGPVLDAADLLQRGEEQRLAGKLAAFEDTTSTAVVVVTLPSLNGAPIDSYAFGLGREWGVGQAEKDNGVVLLVSEGDRKVFIATGYGVEGALPDAIANRIIDQIITPAFRQGQFYAGIDRGTDAIIQATKGEFDAAAAQSASSDDGIPAALIFVLFILVYFVATSFFKGGGGSHKKSRRQHGGMPVIIWGGGGGSHGGGGFGGGGGGFGGFGGGSFGGGGAGGSW